MKTNILIISAILYFYNFSCTDSGPDDPNPPIPKDSCIVYEPILDSISKVRVYTVKDTIADFGYANKVNSISFFNLGVSLNEERIRIHLFSHDQDGGLTDLIIFYIPHSKHGCFEIKNNCYANGEGQFENVCVSFDSNERDVLIDSYLLDSNVINNKIEILSIDTLNKTIEGRFACSFVFANDRPKRDPLNLDTMRFFNGYFKGKYKDR
ncbi:MAG: hypothetical protein IPM48_02570 [Saprospiraceae bacterium]|nr:hypothetical protein [Saprospiraceae bacterium]